ncbi:MAG: DUF6531 domain-containing protein [Gaiellaceae bacterium]
MGRVAVTAFVLLVPLLHGANATPPAASATLAGPTTPILDGFDGRGLEDPLYQWGNWESASIDGEGQTLEILGGTAGHNEGESTEADSYRAADVAGDAEVYATIAADPDNDRDMYLYLHLQETGGPGWDGYRARWFHWIVTDGLHLQKVVDGVATNLVPPVQVEPVAGDTLLLRRTGNALELWHEHAGTWTLRVTASDGAYQSGRIGLGSNDEKGRWDDFGGTGSTTDPPTPPEVPATGVLDDFGRADEDPLSQVGLWASTAIGGAGETLEVLAQAAGQNEAETVQANSFRLAEITGDAEVHARIAAVPDNNQWLYLYLDVQQPESAGWDGYRAAWFHWIATDGLYIQRIDDGVATTIAGPLALDPGTGDTLLLRRFGTTLELWRESSGTGTWTKLLSTLDPSYSSGRLGLGLDDEKGRWDDFGGGAIGAQPPPPPPPPPTGEPPLEQSIGVCSGSGVHARSASHCLSDPVNTLTGAFITQAEDLATPGTGVSFAWSRSYTSSDATVGRLGPGWTDTYATSLRIQPTGDVVLHGDGGQQVAYTVQPDGSFAGSAGAHSTLRSVAGGYELVRVDQVVYRFDAQGRLGSVKDRNAQGLTLAYDGSGRLATITDAAGRRATVSYGAQDLVSQVETQDGRRVHYGYTAGRLTSFTDVRGKGWTYAYDTSGRLVTIVDPLRHVQVTNVYGADGRVASQTDAVGSTTAFAWDAATQVATVTDANGKSWKHDYDEGLLAEQVDPSNAVTGFEHDAGLNTSSVTGPTDETTTMTYDAAGNMLQATAPASLGGVQKTFAYNAGNDPIRITDARGAVTSYAYDGSGNATSVTRAGTPVATFTYDAAGHVLTSTDGNGKTTAYAYDANGNVASTTDPVGNRTTYTYDAAGRVLTRVDPKGNAPGADPADYTWRWTYDVAGQLLTERDPLGHVTSHTYDDAGNELTVTDAGGRIATYAYDDVNRRVRETAPDPDGGGPLTAPMTTQAYDAVGNVVAETDPLGRTTSFTYDSVNRLSRRTAPDPDGSGPLAPPVTTYTYDPNGNLAAVVEPRGNVPAASPDGFRSRYAYDAAGRLLTTTDPLGNVSTNAYDAVGNLASVRDAKRHTTTYAYDASGRLLRVTGPDGGSTTYTYDAAGNRLTRRDDNGRVTSYAYDDAGRLASETLPDPDGSGPAQAPVTRHAYDANGNLVQTVDANGNATPTRGDGTTSLGYDRVNRVTSIDYSDATPDVTFAYDAVGNRRSMTDGAGEESRTYDGLDRLLSVTRGSDTFSYDYDAVGNITRRAYPDGTITDYGYDGLNRLSTAENRGQTTGYDYDAASNLTRTTLPSENGYVETRTYDRAGRLTEVASHSGGTMLARFVSALDPVGNPTEIARTGSLPETQTYRYDASDRVLSVCFQVGTCPAADDPFVRWTYDTLGNRISEQRPSGTTTYAYDAADRLIQAGMDPYTYDQNGNTLSAGNRTFSYDLANRMQTTALGSTTTTYAYDGDGIRLQASTGTQANRTINFLWDVSFGLPQLALERNGRDALLRRYTYGGRRLSATSGNKTSYYHYDGLGSAANLTSSNGDVQWTWSYEPFGITRTEQKANGNQPANLMRFTGEYLDPTGLYHLRARQYDAALGRFLRPDPIDADSRSAFIARYVYAANRPTVLVDPSGETARSAEDGVSVALFNTSLVDWESPLYRCQAALCGGRLPRPPATSCAARPSYPLGVVGGFNGGPAAHRAKPPRNWQSDNAIDLNVPVGTNVCAIFKGRISPSLGFGLSSEGYRLHLVGTTDVAFYQHLSRIVVRRNQEVAKGQLLGFSGCGSERVAHLHLALLRGNPLRYAPPYRKPVNYGGC